MLIQIQQLCRPDGALEMVHFSPATKISPLWGSMIAVIFLFHFTKSISISNVIPQIFLLIRKNACTFNIQGLPSCTGGRHLP